MGLYLSSCYLLPILTLFLERLMETPQLTRTVYLRVHPVGSQPYHLVVALVDLVVLQALLKAALLKAAQLVLMLKPQLSSLPCIPPAL